MHLQSWGARGGAPVVFWHALGPDASADYFAAVGERLGSHGYEVFGVDGPGFGQTARRELDEYRLSALAESLREDVRDLEQPVLIGHSWGGAVVTTYAGMYPDAVRALVLLDSGHIDYVDLAEAGAAMPYEERLAELQARPDPRNAEARALAMVGLADRVSPAWSVLAESAIPTLVFLATEPPHGEQNRAHIGRFQAAVPHADIRWVEGAGHGIVDTTGPELGDEIAAWLEESA